MGEMAAEINQVVPAMCKKATAANALNEKRFIGLTMIRRKFAKHHELFFV